MGKRVITAYWGTNHNLIAGKTTRVHKGPIALFCSRATQEWKKWRKESIFSVWYVQTVQTNNQD